MTDQSQLARFGLFDARVPRYTSYPTAPHFCSDTEATQHASWLGAIESGSKVSLYIHVPFCRRLCWFCACRTQGTTSDAPVRAYLDTLLAELELIRSALPQNVTLSRLHWGGGTPTLMPPDVIRTLAAAIGNILPLSPDGEFSVEIDPNEIDDDRLDALAEAGMNRASIGVQDFDPQIQKRIGRDQSFEITQTAANALRARGIASLNADILFGLPDQTQARIADSVSKLLSLRPDRVALYGYAHVPWMARRQVMIPSDTLPRPEERLRLFETARTMFLEAGYDEIGIDHFALPDDGLAHAAREGKLRRNFQGYTDDTAAVLIGVGASAISRFPGGYTQNAPSTSAHVKAIREGRFSTTRGYVFKGEDKLRARMIEALMCDQSIDAAELKSDFGVGEDQLDVLLAAPLKEFEGVLERTPDGLRIPGFARPLTRMIARSLDTFETPQTAHSSAI